VEAGLTRISFEPASDADADALADLRVAAMRESLQRVGRFDAERARTRFISTWRAEHTRQVISEGRRVGCVVVRPIDDGLLIDHLYVCPAFQGQGIGAAVLADVIAHADARGCGVRLGALRESDANRFYARHGFDLVERTEWDNLYLRPARPPALASGASCPHGTIEP
jgi:GNAT superfamily N-acetyltransferase